MADFKKVAARLERRYGEPDLPPAKGPFELVLWENACYLLPDARRAAVFEGLRQRVGLSAAAIWKADRNTLLELANMGGMRPETRVFRWLEIARITLTQFDGDLDRILKEPYAKARKALHQFPNIGEPGAEKILLFSKSHAVLGLDSNGLRVLVRVGYGREQKSYSSTYRSVRDALAVHLGDKPGPLIQAHQLLRQHGMERCKSSAPICRGCALTEICRYYQTQAMA